jgi:hypothetical protein
MIKTYLYDSSAANLFEIDDEGKVALDEKDKPIETEIAFTAEMKAAVTTYYTPVNTELSGSDNIKIWIHTILLDIAENESITISSSNYTNDDLVTYINLMIKQGKDALVYTKGDE